MKIKLLPGFLTLILSVLVAMYQTGCKKEINAVITPTDTVVNNNDRVFKPFRNIWDSLFSNISREYSVARHIFYKTGLDSTIEKNDTLIFLLPSNYVLEVAGYTIRAIDLMPDSILRKMFLYWTIPGWKIPHDQDTLSVISRSGEPVFIRWKQDFFFVNGFTTADPPSPFRPRQVSVIPFPILLTPPAEHILKIVQTDTSLSYLNAALIRSGNGSTDLSSKLKSNTITLLAPSNNAFREAGYVSIQDINQRNPDELADILRYNMLSDQLFYCDLDKYNFNNFYGPANPNDTIPRSIPTLNGEPLTVQYEFVSGWDDYYSLRFHGKGNKNALAAINSANLTARNGVVHITDKLLLP